LLELKEIIVMERSHLIKHTQSRNSKLRCLAVVLLIVGVSACAAPGYYMQRGAVIGAGAGALIGQAVGRNTSTTLLGAGAGSLVGGFAGYLCDQIAPRHSYQPQQAGYNYPYNGSSSHQGFSIPSREEDLRPVTQEKISCPLDDTW
jgi:hypothetical protein